MEPPRRFDASQGPRTIGPRDPGPGDHLARRLEQFFHDVAVGVAAADEQESRYGTQVDLDSVARLCRQHGLRFPGGGGRPPNR